MTSSFPTETIACMSGSPHDMRSHIRSTPATQSKARNAKTSRITIGESTLISQMKSHMFPELLFERFSPSPDLPHFDYTMFQASFRVWSARYAKDERLPPIFTDGICLGKIAVVTEQPRLLDRWLLSRAYGQSNPLDGKPTWPLVIDIAEYADEWIAKYDAGRMNHEFVRKEFHRRPAGVATIHAMRRTAPCVFELDVEMLGLSPCVLASAIEANLPDRSLAGSAPVSPHDKENWDLLEIAPNTFCRMAMLSGSVSHLWFVFSHAIQPNGDADSRARAFDAVYSDAHALDALLELPSEEKDPTGYWCDLQSGLLTKWPADATLGESTVACIRRVKLTGERTREMVMGRLSSWNPKTTLSVALTTDWRGEFAIEYL